MNIPEYYLNLLAGWNGSGDESHYGSRPILAAILAHYKTKAATKADIIRLLELESTPGFLLGQRETPLSSYYVKRYQNRHLNARLVSFKKAGRVLNYLLDWEAIKDPSLAFDFYSPNWSSIAQVYWWGRLLFGHNVIPEGVLTELKERMSVPANPDSTLNAFNPYILQFMRDTEMLPLEDYPDKGIAKKDVTITEVMLSFITEIAPSDPSLGYYSCLAMIPEIFTVGQPLQNIDKFKAIMQYWNTSMNFPMQQSYYANAIGNPSIERSMRPGMFPSTVRDIIPLVMGKLDRTPQEEQAANYLTPYAGVNVSLANRNPHTYALLCVLYEYHLLLTGQEMFNLGALKAAKIWEDTQIMEAAEELAYLNGKNFTIHRVISVNIERQNRV